MLTPRQKEVAELVAKGLSNKRIARDLGINVETVNEHIRKAAGRLEFDGKPRYKLVLWFLLDTNSPA